MRIGRRRNRHDHDHGHGHGHDRHLPLPPQVGETDGRAGGDYLYERDRLLVAAGDADRAVALLGELDGVDEVEAAGGGAHGVTLLRFASPTRQPPDLVDELRRRGEGLGVAPNHVLARTSHVSLIPVTAPRPCGPRAALYEQPGLPGEGARVGVLDTGATDHPFFAGRCDFRRPDDLDQPDADGDGLLDYAAGHGTFIAGVILQHAPRATVVARRLPADDAHAREESPHQTHISDLELAQALTQLPELRAVDVLSLSLGGYTHEGAGLPATEAALRACRADNPELVVVAGAGNDGDSQPFFPAALKGVVAVGALDQAGRRACFSNYGWWVDACAPGVDVHSSFLHWDGGLAPYPERLPADCDGLLDDSGRHADGFAGWARWDGTSFAAPRVAGAVAARMSAGRSACEALADVLGDPAARRSPLLGTVVNPRAWP